MKKRVIPSILLKGGTNVYLSQQFSPWRSVGALAQYLRLHIQRESDEIIILNPFINQFEKNIQMNRILNIIRKDVNIPISYSGGILNVEDASFIINSGFDKVFVNRIIYKNQNEIKKIASVIGSQSFGACIPYKFNKDKSCFQSWNYEKSEFSDYSVLDSLKLCIDNGVGELILYNVDKDGKMDGMDLQIIESIPKEFARKPILLAGGLGNEKDAYDVLAYSKIQGVVAGSAFALTQTTPSTIRNYCSQRGIKMRQV